MTTTPPLALALAAALATASCERAPDSRVPESASVTLGAIRQGAPAPLTLERGGAEAVIESLAWVVADVELHACVEPAPPSWRALVVREARAHVPDSATRIGIPSLEDLLAEPGRARVWGEIAPPPLAYCALWVIVAPADDDVVNLSDAPTEDVVGHSFLIAGRWRASADRPWEQFSHALAPRRAIPVRFADPSSGSARLELGSERRSAFLLIEKSVGPELFSGIALSSLASEAGAEAVFDRLAQSLSVYTNQRAPARGTEEIP